MARVAVSAPSSLSAQAAIEVIDRGGGAVDAALAAAIAAMVTEPGVVAPGAGAFVTIWPAAGDPQVYDGYMAVPGLGGRHPDPTEHLVHMEYGGGLTTSVGPASVAVPGAWAAFGAAQEDHGAIPWRDVVAPAITLAKSGTPLGPTSAHYLHYSLDPVFGLDEVGRSALQCNGRPVEVGDLVCVDGLASSLERIAVEGADDVYRGDLGWQIGSDMNARGGHLTVEDMRAYRVERRRPLRLALGSWALATNPAPAVGGAALAAMLRLAGSGSITELVQAQRRVFGWRRSGADFSDDRDSAIGRMLADLPGDPIRSASTAHVSTAADDGTVCAVTLSAGYGAGVIPQGTGMWMNNGLGELELVGDGSGLRAGQRLNSNMAPTVGRHPNGRALAIGSPGADRITSAMAQTLLHIEHGMGVHEAIAAPRVHVDVGSLVTIASEPGIDLAPTDDASRQFEVLHMYFGGVGVAVVEPDLSVMAAADPRRNGVAATR